MHSFDTDRAAKEFVRERVDLPVPEHTQDLGDGMALRRFSQELEEGAFTNVYDLSFQTDKASPRIELVEGLTSVFDRVASRADVRVATGGGFFFLADKASGAPRQLGLNLGLQDGQIYSLPVVDREAVLIRNERLSVEYIQAMGLLGIGGAEISWAGSLTDHESDAIVFANGNSIITHVHNDETGSIRVLEETSRYTPSIDVDETVDVGFIRREDGSFVGVNSHTAGRLDIFSHDVVVRMHERHVHGGLPVMHILTLGSKAIDNSLRGAISVGPMLDTENFTTHPINADPSLGGKPPFLNVPLARTVLYETNDNRVHIQLFDGRPGSPVFPGVTPSQAAQLVERSSDVSWGCFLDPGQTAKLAVRGNDSIGSYGNTHYLRWPRWPGEKFVWVPKSGRPVASMITLR